MASTILPFHHSDDFGYEIPIKTRSRTTSYAHFCQITLYNQVLAAQARHDKSLIDLPTELLIHILVISAFSRETAWTLAYASSWISDVTLAVRMEHVSIRTMRQLRSFNKLVYSSSRAAIAVRKLWIATNAGGPAEQIFIPDIVRACINLRALACQVGPLLALCSAGDPFLPSRVQLTVMDNMHAERGVNLVSQWSRIILSIHGIPFLQNITHLHLPCYHYAFTESFPAAHLPRLTHLAMISRRWHPPEFILDFGRALDRLSLRLTMVVLVLWEGRGRRNGPQFLPPWYTREMVQAARDCSENSNVVMYCPSESHQQLKFWNATLDGGEDIWSLARRQMAMFSDSD
ncbi:hypothetical protein DFH07DRAFT_972848 [Mycena maculata]|uniref:F-box domain-containing protein n=1 Tax=Mycena maculata TaxID=230809 RepID=A0AAD7MIW0_9AGAR|nr:hypothetical protein DFH07DRAFT_972848 [Mycena maculata]